MSYVSKELKFEERPIYKFVSTIKSKYQTVKKHLRVKLFDSIGMTNVLKDLYDDQNICETYVFHKSSYDGILNKDGEMSMYQCWIHEKKINMNIFKNDAYNMSEFTVPFKKNEADKHFKNYIRQLFNFLVLSTVYRIPIFDDDIYNLSNPENTILYFINVHIKSSKNIKTDIEYLLFVLGRMLTFENCITSNESLLFAIVNNKYFDKNEKFISNFLKALITKKYDHMGVYKNLFQQFAANSVMNEHKFLMFMTDADDENNDVLTFLLKALHFERIESDDYDSNNSSKNKSVFYDEDQSVLYSTSMSFQSMSDHSDEQDRKQRFKSIIKNLLKLSERYNTITRDEYLNNLLQFKESLLEIGINLDDYKFYKSLKSSPMQSVERSFDNDPRDSIVLKDNENIFQHPTADVHFIDDFLFLDLKKIYIRTVEGMADNEYTHPNRILKIRKYLQKKYPVIIDYKYIINVRSGNELDTLYDHWLKKSNRFTLNTEYDIQYIDEEGIDAGGLTRQFFSKAAKQLKTKYFRPVHDGSDRYILNTDDTAVAHFIGEFIATLILKEIYLEFNMSIIGIAHLMYLSEDISENENFLYYLLDIDSKMRYNNNLQYCDKNYPYNALKPDDPSNYPAVACNPVLFIKNYFSNFYDIDSEAFKAFCKGFFINKKIFYGKFANIKSRIRIYDFDKMLSLGKISKKELKKRVFDNLQLSYNLRPTIEEGEDTSTLDFLEFIMVNAKKEDYNKLYKQYDTKRFASGELALQTYDLLSSANEFRKQMLMYWTGSYGILSQTYKININSSLGSMPKSHTCMNQLDLPTNQFIKTKEDLYNMFMDIFIAGHDNVFSVR
jgi:hypothetical protein